MEGTWHERNSMITLKRKLRVCGDMLVWQEQRSQCNTRNEVVEYVRISPVSYRMGERCGFAVGATLGFVAGFLAAILVFVMGIAR